MNQIEQKEDRTQALRRLLVSTVEQTAATPVRARRAPRLIALSAGLAIAAVATVLAVPGLSPLQPTTDPTGQTGGVSSGSRLKLYTSVDELVADSGAVVTARVVSQQAGADGTIVSSLKVSDSYTPSGLGANLAGPTPVAEGGEIRVTTFGAMTSAGSAQLELGKEYLMFVTPTGLPGGGQDEFFVTGVSAGLYVADGNRFIKAPSEGDSLPQELTPEILTGG